VSSGSLTASFSGGIISNVNLSLTVPINANTYSLTTQSSLVSGSTFEAIFAYNGNVVGGSARGVFSAGDARYVGATYNFSTMSNEQVSGAVVLKR
jgi:peptide subunit release factor RF-3